MRLPIVIGDYRLLDLIGGGSFGTVYRAEIVGSMGFSQQVAVKVLDPMRARERPELIRSLADEAQLLSRISHPNIVQVRQFVHADHEVLGDTYLMVMELVKGESVRSLLDHLAAARAVIPVETVLAMLSEAADALAYAHNAAGPDGAPMGLVHRDLKPANLMVTREGRLKVLDFGIAWAAERLVSATATGMTKGTVLYMSPEQVRGLQVDGRSDVYCLGLIVFELLTGELFTPLPPGGLGDLTGVLRMVAETTSAARLPALQEALLHEDRHALGADLTGPLVALLGRMLAEDPAARPSAREVADTLDELPGAWRFNRGRGFLRDLLQERRMARGAPAEGTLTPPPTRVPAPATLELDEDPAPARRAPLLPDPEADAPPPPSPAPVVPTVDAPAQPLDTRLTRAHRARRVNPALGVALMIVGLVMVGVVLVLARGDGAAEVAEAVDAPGQPEDWAPGALAGSLAEPLPEAATPEPEATPDPTPRPRRRARRVARRSPTPEPATPAPPPTPAPRQVSDDPPKVKVRHRPPKVAVPGSMVRFTARLEGDIDACTPRVFLGPADVGKYVEHPLDPKGSGKFTKSVALPYSEAYARGVRYFIRCCDAGGQCYAGWRTASSPKVVRPPSY